MGIKAPEGVRVRPPIKKGTTPFRPEFLARMNSQVKKEPVLIIKPQDQAAIVTAVDKGLKVNGDRRGAMWAIVEAQKDQYQLENRNPHDKLKKKMPDNLQRYFKKCEASNKPEKKVIPIDFSIATKQLQISRSNAEIDWLSTEIAKEGIKPELKTKYEEKRDEIAAQKVQLTSDLEEVTKLREPFGETPNSFTEIAKSFGADDNLAKNNPLEIVMSSLEDVHSGVRDKGQLMKRLVESGAPKDIQSAADDVLRVMEGHPTKRDRNLNIITTGSFIGAAGLFAMAWKAENDEQQGQKGYH